MVVGGSKRLFSPNPTTVMVVLLLGFLLLLGCDNIDKLAPEIHLDNKLKSYLIQFQTNNTVPTRADLDPAQFILRFSLGDPKN